MLDPESLATHLDRLMRAALAMCGSRADAEDLVQEVCLRVLAKPRVVRGNELAYLHGVLRNTFISDYQTRIRRRTTPVEPGDAVHVPAGAPRGPGDPGARTARCAGRSPTCPATTATRSSRSTSSGSPTPRPRRRSASPDGTIMSRLYRGRAAVAERVGAPGAGRRLTLVIRKTAP